MKTTGRQSYKRRQQAKKLWSFNSQWKPGDKLRVFYRILPIEEGSSQWDIMTAECWGHDWDPTLTSLKRIFIPTTSEIDEYGDPKTKDALYQASMVAPLILEGQQHREENDIRENDGMTDKMKETALKKISKDYEFKNPLCRKLDLKIFTECLVVPVDKDDKPDFDKARLVSQDLSNKKMDAIFAAVSKAGNIMIKDGDDKVKKEIIDEVEVTIDERMGIVEILYAFKDDEKKSDAGDITPLGVTNEEALLTNDAYKDKVLQLCGQLPDDSEVIFNRNSNTKKVEPVEIKQAFATYAAQNYKAIDSLEDDEVATTRLLKHIDVIKTFGIPVKMPALIEKLDELKKAEEEAAEALASADKSNAPTIDELQEKNKISKEEIKEARDNVTEGLTDREESLLGGSNKVTEGTDITSI